MFTSNHRNSADEPEYFALSVMHLANYSRPQVRIGNLDGARSEDVLRGRAVPRDVVRAVDPGRPIGDLIGTYWVALFLLSERFVGVLHAAGLSGFTVSPVRTDGSPEIATLLLLQVTGECGPVIDTGDGQALDLSTWDGSDFFAPPYGNRFYLSDRAADVIQRARLRNVEIVPEYFSRWTPFSEISR